MALLVLAAEFHKQTGIPFQAVSVDHGLRPEAAAEVRFVAETCRQLGVQHHALRWQRTDDGPVGQEMARRARHRLLAGWARSCGIGHVALGHTQDDRLETFLMRARQGSGWHGLAGLMPNGPSPVWPEGRGLSLVRPLLAFRREDLRNELRKRDCAWVEDPSNTLARFERVRMRQLLQRMDNPARDKTLNVMNRLMQLRAAVVAEAGELCRQVHHDTDACEADILLTARGKVGAEAWLRFIEAMVMGAGGAERPPRREALDRLIGRIAACDPQLEKGMTLAGAKVRIRKKSYLHITRAPPRRGAIRRDDDGPDWRRAHALLEDPDLEVLKV